MAQLMPLPLTVSCFSKIQIGFTFLVTAHPGSPGKRAVKRVCVCVCVWVGLFTSGGLSRSAVAHALDVVRRVADVSGCEVPVGKVVQQFARTLVDHVMNNPRLNQVRSLHSPPRARSGP